MPASDIKKEKLPYKLRFSIFPGEEYAQYIFDRGVMLATDLGLVGNPQRVSRLHVTLHDMGGYDEFPQDRFDACVKAGDAFQATRLKPFDVEFGEAATLGSNFAIFGDPDSELARLQQDLGKAIKSFGLRPSSMVNPFITLLYNRVRIPKQEILPIEWRVEEFVLIKSYVGKGHHEFLKRWKLR